MGLATFYFSAYLTTLSFFYSPLGIVLYSSIFSFHYFVKLALSPATKISEYLFLIMKAFSIPHSDCGTSIKSLFRIHIDKLGYLSFAVANK